MPGRILNGMAEVYFKPSTGQLIIRKVGSHQTSEKLKEVQRKFARKAAGNKIAKTCKGKKWSEFKSCLRVEGQKAIGKGL